MHQTHSTKEKTILLLKLFYPILLAQVCLMATSFLDTVMAGRAGADDLAGVAIGSSIWFPFQACLLGVLSAFTPFVANMLGSEDSKENIRKMFIQSMYAAFTLAVLSIIFGYLLFAPMLQTIEATASVKEIAIDFLSYLSFGFIPLFLFTVCRCFFEVHGKTLISLFISLAILPINTFINYLLIYGNWGFPELGGAGTGIASAISYWVLFIIAMIVLFRMKIFKSYQLFSKFYRPQFSYWKKLFATGIPIGLAILFESSIFAIVTLLMSNFPTETIAAHQAAINFSSLLFMVPLSIAMTLTIAVGYEYGAKRLHDAKQYGRIGIISAVCFAMVAATTLYFMREPIARLYTKDPALEALIAHFLIYAIFFQFSDALQAPIQGILRGYKDVRVTLYIALTGYWAIGLPAAYYFGNHTDLGAYGFWVGIIFGLSTVAVGLLIRLRIVETKLTNQYHAATT